MSSQLSLEKLKILSSPPFVNVEGMINMRDAGGHLSSLYNKRVKPGYIFRAGDPSHITERGKDQLLALGVKTIFDLRSDTEIESYKSATLMVDGIEFVKTPVSRAESYAPASLALRLKAFETDITDAFLKLYVEILENGHEAIEKILVHLRDKPEQPCLIHCTAGKDRTGLFVAVIMLLLGVSDDEIIKDYALTTVGLEPVLPHIMGSSKSEEMFRKNMTSSGALNMISSHPETMVATLKVFRDKYGTAEGYLKTHTALTDHDIALIRSNMLVPVL